MRATTLDDFARWLAQRQRLGTAVRTVGQVIGGPVRPTPHVAPAAPHGIVNPSLESVAASGAVSASLETTSAAPATTPRCWMEGGYGQQHRPLAADHGQPRRAVGSAADHDQLSQR